MVRTLGVVLASMAAAMAFVFAIVTLNPVAALEGFLMGANGLLTACNEDESSPKPRG